MPDPTTPATETPPVIVATGAPASTPAVTPVPAPKPDQPTPGAQKPGEPAPGAVTPEPQTVPIGALLDERGKRQSLEAELALLRQPAQAAPHMPQQQQPDQQAQMAQEIDRLWDSDPRKAVETTVNSNIMMAIDWYDRINTSVDQQADALAGKYPDFNQHRSDAQRYVRGLPFNQRGQPGALEMAYFIVRGLNVDVMMQRQNEELMRKFQTGELASQVSTPTGTFSTPAVPSGIQLTDEQRTAASAMGMTEEDYASQIKIMPPTGAV